MEQPIFEKVIEILGKYSFEKKKLETAKPEMKLIEDIKINSARIVDIVLDVEEDFDIEIDDDNLEKLVCIGDIVEVIKQKS